MVTFQTVEVDEPKDGLNLQVSFIGVLIIISQKDTILTRNGQAKWFVDVVIPIGYKEAHFHPNLMILSWPDHYNQ